MQLTNDPGAPAYYAVPLDETHPHRQKEVVREVNKRIAGKRPINMHDIVCIRRVYSIQKQIRYCYTQNFASPRYSKQFVDWIVDQFEANNGFFDETRAKFDALKGAQ
jgi:hypothetical protein